MLSLSTDANSVSLVTVSSRISKWYFFSKIVWYRGSWTLLIWYGTSSVVTSRVILRQMTKIIEFKLNLDTHKNIFAPVDQIPCNVILTLDGQLQTKGIEVSWECKWKCAFISVQDAFLLPLLLFFFFFFASIFFLLKDMTLPEF